MNKLRISVVEDQEEMRSLLTGFLINNGFEVIGEFANGKEAYDGMDRERTDILISDFNMPHMTGDELIYRLRKQGFKKPSFCWSSMAGTVDVDIAGFNQAFDKSQVRELVAHLKTIAA